MIFYVNIFFYCVFFHESLNLKKICFFCFKGAECFNAKVNIEVQWASEPVIAAIERNGGVITNAYYDMISLEAITNVEQFFSRGNSKRIVFI